MARKKITHLYSKKIPKNRISESADISDVKHDLENQIIKIHQELENLRLKVHLPDKSLTDVYRELCGTHPYEISKSLTFIDRLVYQMFCEMACITILDWKDDKIESLKIKNKTILHKILLRILRLYENEMNDVDIRYELSDSISKWDISEYVFSGIILKIVQNCSKYCKPWSKLKIQITENQIIFEMESLKIEYSERQKIFENNFSWRNAKKLWKWWTGKWLYHAKRLADFHELNLRVETGDDKTEHEWNRYAVNKFILELRS